MRSTINLLLAATAAATLFVAAETKAYPLDDSERTEIYRLEGYHWSLGTPSGKDIIPFGARLRTAAVEPLFKGYNFDIPATDYQLEAKIRSILARHGSEISLSLIDLSDRSRPVYVGINDRRPFIPGSTGKVMIALTVLAKLQQLYPHQPELREKVLREAYFPTDSIINTDTHVVPFWNRNAGDLSFRPLVIGDEANLWTYLDWMISASSNAAASAIFKQLVLLDHFGHSYPPTPSEAHRYWQKTTPAFRAQVVARLSRQAIAKAGFDPSELVQTSLFTKEGKLQIPSRGSTANTRTFIRLLLKMEQGRLIDEFTSAELKRIMYFTQRRIRYADAPELENAAVFFKAGSLYKCGGPCEQYQGTIQNLLTGVATIEDEYHHYLVVLNTNVLRKNSSEMHRRIAGEIHNVIKARYKSPYQVLAR